MEAEALTGGFADPAVEAARAFRAILDAMARPGRIGWLAGAAPPAPLSPAAGAAVLTLADRTTPLWLAPGHDTEAVRGWITFHTGAPLVSPGAAVFAVGRWAALIPLDRYPLGTPEYPDRGATLIVEVDDLAPVGARLTGPGIDGAASLNLPDPGAHAWVRRQFPLGLDMLFCAGDRIAGLPRSTVVTVAPDGAGTEAG
jgi:alpha-D-ribose 1-methylphosphonate 5-triphosphate synthase subunit PhnH